MSIESLFLLFLTEYKCYSEFMGNLIDKSGINSIDDYFIHLNKNKLFNTTQYTNIISISFDWSQANENSDYWMDKSIRWSKFYNANKHLIKDKEQAFASIW